MSSYCYTDFVHNVRVLLQIKDAALSDRLDTLQACRLGKMVVARMIDNFIDYTNRLATRFEELQISYEFDHRELEDFHKLGLVDPEDMTEQEKKELFDLAEMQERRREEREQSGLSGT